MVAPVPSHDIILVMGPARPDWPRPLGELVAADRIRIESYASMHAISARLAGCDKRIRALLLDPCILTPRDLAAVDTIARYVRLPIALLPLIQGASACARSAKSATILSWDEAVAGFHAVAESAPVLAEIGPAGACGPAAAVISPVLTDNRTVVTTDIHTENFMTPDAPNRYDGIGIEPLISPQEMAALLGVEQ